MSSSSVATGTFRDDYHAVGLMLVCIVGVNILLTYMLGRDGDDVG